MIDSLRELNEVVNAVANRALDVVAERSTSGQRYVGLCDFGDLISQEDFERYADLIVSELNTREEILEPVVLVDGELDINMGLSYLKAYHWTPGDEEIFGCSFEEWLEMESKPVYHPLSLSRMAEVGERAVDFLRDPHRTGKALNVMDLGLRRSEWESLKANVITDFSYNPAGDLYIGKWRIHIADTGEKHGTFMHLFNAGKPIVEFYDMTCIDPKFAPNGQFTTGRYNVDTILNKDGYGDETYPFGLSLQGDCPSWTVSSEEMKIVVSYLKSFDEYKARKKPHLSSMISTAEQKKDCSAQEDAVHKPLHSPQR